MLIAVRHGNWTKGYWEVWELITSKLQQGKTLERAQRRLTALPQENMHKRHLENGGLQVTKMVWHSGTERLTARPLYPQPVMSFNQLHLSRQCKVPPPQAWWTGPQLGLLLEISRTAEKTCGKQTGKNIDTHNWFLTGELAHIT